MRKDESNGKISTQTRKDCTITKSEPHMWLLVSWNKAEMLIKLSF